MKNFFTALGIVVLGVFAVIFAVVLMYLSYILAIGAAIILGIWLIYTLLKVSSDTK